LFHKDGYICKGRQPTEQPVSVARTNATQAPFTCSPRKSTEQAPQQLHKSQLAVQKNSMTSSEI